MIFQGYCKNKMKKGIIFRGTATALITPFRGGEIDYGALFSIIDMQLDAKIEALVVGGTTGEAATLDESERYHLYSKCAEYINGRAKLIFGTGTNDTKCAVRHTRRAAEIGCDGVLVVTPYYNKGTEIGIVRHYLEIAEASEVPIILYNVPSRTGVNLSINQLKALSEHPMIYAIKEASDSLERLVDISTLGSNLRLYSGNDSQTFSVLALGGLGTVSVISNLLPKQTKAVCDLYFDGQIEKSRLMAAKLLPLIRAIFAETNPAPIKYAMSKCGLCTAEVRLPLTEPSEKTRALIDKLISEYGV